MEQLLAIPPLVWRQTKRSGRYAGRVLIDSLLIISQFCTYPFTTTLMFLWRVRIRRPKPFIVPPGSLILSNHQSFYDPFFITYNLGSRNWPRLMPCRYPVKSEVFKDMRMSLPIRALGGYDMGETTMERAKKLLFTRELLDQGRTVILFPEGAITNNGEMIGDFQQGAQMLFTRGYPVVFVKLEGFTQSARRQRPFWRWNMRITYSPVMQGSAEELREKMMEFFRNEASNAQ